MQVASGHATIGSLRKDAGKQTQELSQRLEQVSFSAASFYGLYDVLHFLSMCVPHAGHLRRKAARARTGFLVN